MGRLDDIDATLGTVNSGLDAITAEVTQLAGQVAQLQADTVTQAEIDKVAADATAIAGRLGGIRDSIDAIVEPDAGETPPPGEPPVDPTVPPVEGNPDFKG